jgi:hypothetical protein
MGEHSWVRVIAGASALQVPRPVTPPAPAGRPAQGIPAKIPPMPPTPSPTYERLRDTIARRMHAASGTGAATAPRSAARSKSVWDRLLLGKPRTSEPWRWTTSCPGTMAARTTSATCRPSASAAMPAGLALHQPEWNAVVELLKQRREQLSAQNALISCWYVGLNSGDAAGQAVFHAHWHFIPRLRGIASSRGVG